MFILDIQLNSWLEYNEHETHTSGEKGDGIFSGFLLGH